MVLTDTEGPDQSYHFLLFLILSQRVNQCLRDACSASTIPYCDSFIDCGRGIGSGLYRQQWFNDLGAEACFNTGNNATFQYGIYEQAVLLTIEDSAVKRYIYSLFWGFQVFAIICLCLSTFVGVSLLHPKYVTIWLSCIIFRLLLSYVSW